MRVLGLVQLSRMRLADMQFVVVISVICGWGGELLDICGVYSIKLESTIVEGNITFRELATIDS